MSDTTITAGPFGLHATASDPCVHDSITDIATVGDLCIHHLGLTIAVDDGERVHRGALRSIRISPAGELYVSLGSYPFRVSLTAECGVIADA